jgi:PIN domain nuclease of toxin-antitoxin system
VSGYLPDTNAAPIALTDPEKLPTAVGAAARGGPNFLSVVSHREIVIKSTKGKLRVGDPRTWWRDAVQELAADLELVTIDQKMARYASARLREIS